MSGNCELGRGLRRREKNATEAGAGRFEKPAPDARAAPPEAHESLIGRKTVEEVPLTGLSFTAEDVRHDKEQAVDTATKAALQAKEDFETRLKSGLADMDAEVAKPHEKCRELKDDANG